MVDLDQRGKDDEEYKRWKESLELRIGRNDRGFNWLLRVMNLKPNPPLPGEDRK